MALIRPKVLVHFGRQNEPIRVPNSDLIADTTKTFLTADMATGTTLTVKNIIGFQINQVLCIGEPGNQGSEIVKTHASSAPSGSTITLAATTLFAHSAGTNVYLVNFDQVEFSSAATVTGSKTVLVTTSVTPGLIATIYNDTASTTGFYFARFKNTIATTFSSYSDAAPVAGYTPLMARRIIDGAIQSLNKSITATIITDEYAFLEIDNCQMEVLRELKRWSFMQQFDYILTQISTGFWVNSLPTDCDDQNTDRSTWKVRVGREHQLTWVDKEKFNEFVDGVAYTTLAANLTVGATTATLTNSHDFTSGGTVQIRNTQLAYTANNSTTGVLSLTLAVITPYASGVEVFEYPSLGLPRYFTIYGGKIYVYPVVSSTYNGRNLYIDYYKLLTAIVSDTDLIVLPDPTVVQYYLEWKFLKRINNGNESQGSLAAKQNYLDRRERMKQKDVMNRNFVLKPRYNNFAVQSQLDDRDTRRIRDGNFPNI